MIAIDIEMPTTCEDCPLLNTAENLCVFKDCNYTIGEFNRMTHNERQIAITTRHSKCPLHYLEELKGKKGKWIRQKSMYGGYDNTYECSECGRVIYCETEEDLIDYPYCHCGAKMSVLMEW